MAFLGLATPAWSECTHGDVLALFHSFPVFSRQRAQGQETHMAKLFGPDGGPCQYRLFFGVELDSGEAPPIKTFTEDQYFMGAVVYLWDYKNVGLTRQQASDDLRLVEEHVYLMPTDDDWSFNPVELKQHEVPLMETAMRNSNAPVQGQLSLIVWRQRGIIEQLPAGHYVSLYTSSYPGNPELAALHPDDPDWTDLFAPLEFTSVVNLEIVAN